MMDGPGVSDPQAAVRSAREDAPPHDILVIDDDPANLTAIEVALGEFGRRIVKARSGREALRYLLEQDFALILLDVQMPQMDGFETARLIRSRERSAHVPIIFVTAHTRDDRDVLRGYRLGAVDFLFKPIVPEVLRAKAAVFVSLQERTEEVRRQAERLRRMERRELEQKLADERQRWETEKLREENERKDEFLAILSHELRNPLASIVAGLELMGALELSSPQFDNAHALMNRQVNHLTRLVDDLLDISRISRGKISLDTQRVDLRSAVNQALDGSRLVAADRHRHVNVSLPEDPVWVEGDRDRLIQVVANLLNNAVRYSEPEAAIDIELRDDAGHARLRVSDEGCGIEPDMIDHIFDLFAQERTDGRGLGLGLALVHRLVQMHGGEVVVSSDGRGQGAEFEIRLPLVVPSAEDVLRKSDPGVNLSQDHVALRVALVDDDHDVRAPMCSLLEAWGHQVSSAECGCDGVDLVVRSRPDIVLMDIGMPDIDGYEAAKRIREHLCDSTPRLVAMTGYGSPSDRESSRRAGFDAHLVKPARPDDLRRVLQGTYDDDLH